MSGRKIRISPGRPTFNARRNMVRIEVASRNLLQMQANFGAGNPKMFIPVQAGLLVGGARVNR